MKYIDVYVTAIIPAKTDSTRLKKKNLRIINGKTLLEHSIDYALKSEYIKDIIVSTESDEVKKICESYDENISIYGRPDDLLKDAEVADVYVDLFQKQFKKNGEWRIPQMTTHVVGLQPDHPDRTNDLDSMIEYFIDNKYDDLVTVDKEGTRNGSVRIVKVEYVKHGTMSRRVGSMLDDCTNIHNEHDLKQAELNIGEKYE
tara:strand:+ start:2044 stop:2646 length:603 start_codon:yes stop_codon:yes gene_type:complete